MKADLNRFGVKVGYRRLIEGGGSVLMEVTTNMNLAVPIDVIKITYLGAEAIRTLFEDILLVFFYFLRTDEDGVFYSENTIGVLKVSIGTDYEIAPYQIYLGDTMGGSVLTTMLICQSDRLTQKKHIIAFPNSMTYLRYGLRYYGRRYDVWPHWNYVIGNPHCYVPDFIKIEGESAEDEYKFQIATSVTYEMYSSRHPFTLNEDGTLSKWDINVRRDEETNDLIKYWDTVGTGIDGWTDKVNHSTAFSCPNNTYSVSSSSQFWTGEYTVPEWGDGSCGCDPYYGSSSAEDNFEGQLVLDTDDNSESGSSENSPICLIGDEAIYAISDSTYSSASEREDVGEYILNRSGDAIMTVRYLSMYDSGACNWPEWLDGETHCHKSLSLAETYDIAKTTGSESIHYDYYVANEIFKSSSHSRTFTNYSDLIVNRTALDYAFSTSGVPATECWGVTQIDWDPHTACDIDYSINETPINTTKEGLEAWDSTTYNFLDFDHTWDNSVILLYFTKQEVSGSRTTQYQIVVSMATGGARLITTETSYTNNGTTTYYIGVRIDGAWHEYSLGTSEVTGMSLELNSKFAVYTYMQGGVRKMGIVNVDDTNGLPLGHQKEFTLTADDLIAVDDIGNILPVTIDHYAVVGAHFLGRRNTGTELVTR